MATSEKLPDVKKFITHGGIFHADEVFAMAFLILIYGYDIPYERVFKVTDEMKKDSSNLIFDIGYGEFDHHQNNKEYRTNGIPYAAFGLIAREFYPHLLTDDAYEILDEKFIQEIDNHDNTGSPSSICSVISAFNPTWVETGSDFYFEQAIDVAVNILDRQIQSACALSMAKMTAEYGVEDAVDGVIWLEKYCPINDFVRDKEDIFFIGSPSLRGGYQVIAIKNEDGTNKMLFPEMFRIQNTEEWAKYGMTFCHSSGFMAVFEDIDAAKHFMHNWVK